MIEQKPKIQTNEKTSFPVEKLWRIAVIVGSLAIVSTVLGFRLFTVAQPPPEETPTNHLYLPVISKAIPGWARTYYVDSSIGNDQHSCNQAQSPTTPKKTVSSILSCDPGPGQTVRFRGEFKETIYPGRNGIVLYAVQDIAQVSGSVVTFNQDMTGIYPPTDYVAIYGSRKGNSGAFSILSVSENRITVDTTNLPGGVFRNETDLDPGDLQAAILRPVHFTAWDKDDPPVWSGEYQAYHAINTRVVMVSYLISKSGEAINPGWPVWAAFKIDGSDYGNSDFQIFDHLEVLNAECAIAVEFNEFQSNYDIIQFTNLHDIGHSGAEDISHEIIYFGNPYHPERHHDYVQIMYNKVGPHNADAPTEGDGIEIKPSAHNATVFGNEILGIQPNGCDDAPIKIAGMNAFVANNYIHDIYPNNHRGCGISIVEDSPMDPTGGGEGAIVVNNIVANVERVGIRVIDADNVQIINNTIFNIFPEPNCNSECMEQNMGIEIQNWQSSTENIVIKNNIVQKAYIGIGRYIWSSEEYPVSIDSDFNIVFDAQFPFRGSIVLSINDLIIDPRLVNPEGQNFALASNSPARNSAMDFNEIFNIDNHDSPNPTLPFITAPIFRGSIWDRGAFEDN